MKFLIFKKKHIKYFLIAVLLLVIMAINVNGEVLAQVYFGENIRKIPIYRVDTTQEMKVALTFDAAWGADKTEGIMEVLKEYNAKATFFLVGFWVEKYPEMTKKIKDNGFEIGTHSFNHPDMVKLSREKMELELVSSCEMIEKTAGVKPKLFRPPFGSYNNALIETCEKLNLKAIQWDVDTLDWKGLKPAEVTKRVLSKVQKGSIILCHNNADHVIDSTRMVLDRLKNMGYSFCTVGELVGV